MRGVIVMTAVEGIAVIEVSVFQGNTYLFAELMPNPGGGSVFSRSEPVRLADASVLEMIVGAEEGVAGVQVGLVVEQESGEG